MPTDNDKIKINDLFDDIPELFLPLFDGIEYPWELLPRLRDFAAEFASREREGFTLLRPGVLVGEGVRIAATAVIEGSAVICRGTELRPGAYLRGGAVVGEDCVIGNSTELKNCLLIRRVQVPHYNYVGDSVLGTRSHMGAGAICSNLRSDNKCVVVHGDRDYATGLPKMGAILGDGAEIGCGCVLSPGTVVGKRTSVYPLTHLRHTVPADSIVKAPDNIVRRT